jgi:hypothetical protein
MKIPLKASLFLAPCLGFVMARAQTAAPADQPKAQPAAQAYSFDTDSRASVKAFKQELQTYYNDSQNKSLDKKVINEDFRQLRFAATVRTATTMLNSGMQILDLDSAFANVVTGLSQARPDKQVAAQSSSAGSTSLVSKAGGSSILAMAVDSGALTQSSSGTTSTVSGNLEGIGSLLLGQAPISIDPTKQNWLRKTAGDVNLSASFALAQPSSQSTASTQPATGTSPPAGTQVNIPSSVGKLTGITAQFAIHNPFDPHSAAMRSRWEATKKQVINAAASELLAANPVVRALNCTACDQDWVDAQKDFATAASNRNQQGLADAFDLFIKKITADANAFDANFESEVVAAAKATATYQNAARTAVDNTLGNMFTAEYDYSKPANQPETHDFKLVYGYAMNSTTAINTLLTSGSGAKSLFTANADISIYGGTIPASAKYGRLHYGQISAEFDTPILGTPPAKLAVFSLAGYWQYQPDPSMLNITQSDVAPGTSIPAPTQVLVGTAGSLWVAQAKITVKNGKSGISVPFGVKWSNKSDLLSGNKIGAQVGISYDFSSLNNLFGGSN